MAVRVTLILAVYFAFVLSGMYVIAYYARYTKTRIKYKLMKMDQDLYRDSYAKVKAIQYMKRHYRNADSYRLAEVVYEVRRKYIRMLFVYFRALDNLNTFRPDQHFELLREIQHIQMNIDNLILAMEEWEDKDTRKKRITRTGKENKGVARTFRNQKEISEFDKQKAYIERKKMEWSLLHGKLVGDLNRKEYLKKDVVEEGFESDVV